MENKNIQTTSTSTSTSNEINSTYSTTTGIGNSIYAQPSCKYRLPCGLCELTKQMCSELPNTRTLDINWDTYQTITGINSSDAQIDHMITTLKNSTTSDFIDFGEKNKELE